MLLPSLDITMNPPKMYVLFCDQEGNYHKVETVETKDSLVFGDVKIPVLDFNFTEYTPKYNKKEFIKALA